MLEMMHYLSELVHAQLEYKRTENIPAGIEIEELIEIAHKNHMENLILGPLLKLELSDEIKSNIKPFVIHSAMISMIQTRCLKELEENFEKEGIYHQALKGSVLKTIYPSPEMREMSDIDVMIYDVNLNRAKKVVEDMGFTLTESVKHHDIYSKAPFLFIELHHTLFDKDVDHSLYEYFKNEKHLIAKDGRKYALHFGIEDFYVYLIAHMAKHFFETGCGIRNVIDVYFYRRIYEATWVETIITTELETCGLKAFESRIHTLAQVWLDGKKADYFSIMLFNYMTNCGIYGKGKYGLWGKFVMLNKSNNRNDQFYAKWWYYFPPISYMEGDYAWLKKYPFLLIVAWGMRAVHGLLSKEGREKRKMLININSEDVRTLNQIYRGMELHFKKE